MVEHRTTILQLMFNSNVFHRHQSSQKIRQHNYIANQKETARFFRIKLLVFDQKDDLGEKQWMVPLFLF